MIQQKHTLQDISQPPFIQPQSRHTLRLKGHVSPSVRRKISSKTSPIQLKQSKSLVEQALDLAAELPPLPDDWDYKDALADAIQQRFEHAVVGNIASLKRRGYATNYKIV